VAVENDNLRRTELDGACEFRHDLMTQSGISRQQPERNLAMRFAATHSLRQIERAVLAFARQPLEAAPNQQLQSLREIIPLEERAPIDLAGREILDLCDLLD
jgi:hypothetical protein